MPKVDIECGSHLDKIHTNRMLHAFAQLAQALIGLEDGRVNAVLRQKGIVVAPGPVVGIEYGPGDIQILELDLASANNESAALAKPKPVKKARKR